MKLNTTAQAVIRVASPYREPVRRVISLPAINRCVSLSNYVAGIKTAKANPNAIFPHSLTHWGPATGQEIVQQFRDGLTDRINRHLRISQKPDKDLRNFAWRINHRSMIRPTDLAGLPHRAKLEARFAHRITQPWEE